MNSTCSECGRAPTQSGVLCAACSAVSARAPTRAHDAMPAPLVVLLQTWLADLAGAEQRGDARVVGDLQARIRTIDPFHRALTARGMPAEARANAAERPMASEPQWRTPWMARCGEDSFGRWALANIAGVEVLFRHCPAGTFTMGTSAQERSTYKDEGPQHGVRLTRSFWLAQTPVTQRLWTAVAGDNPSHFLGDNLPVESVSWDDCTRWVAKARVAVPALALRLPTEAEWEYACRAGTTSETYAGKNIEEILERIAWFEGNSGGSTREVQQKEPNPWGLHDMIGNVWEWCSDSQRKYSESRMVDPSGGESTERVFRGGSWRIESARMRAGFRNARSPDYLHYSLGLRLACDDAHG